MKGPVGIVGAGYVGLPLAQVFAEAGTHVLLIEANPEKVALVKRGESYIRDVPSEGLAEHVESGAIEITSDYDALKEADAILIALQTPLTAQREPDLRRLRDHRLVSRAGGLRQRLRRPRRDPGPDRRQAQGPLGRVGPVPVD